MKSILRPLSLLGTGLLALGLLGASAVQAADPHIDHVWTGGSGTHADGFSVSVHGDHLHLDFHDTEGTHASDSVLILAGENRVTNNATYTSLLSASSDVWVLPHSPTSESPGYDWVGMSNWTDATLTLESVTTPAGGTIKLWEVDLAPEVFWDSTVATPQSFVIGAPAHGHVGWGFTHEGLYTLVVKASATDPSANAVASGSKTYYVCVTSDDEADLEALCGIELHGHGGGEEPVTDGAVDIQVDVAGESGGLSLSVAAGSVSLAGGAVEGDLFRYTGHLPNVTVLDQRAGANEWSVSGIASNFSTSGEPADTFSAACLGWTPEVVDQSGLTAGHVHLGGVVAPDCAGTDAGLSVSRNLGHTHGGGNGTATLSADLTLEIPVSTAPGSYSSTLTLTVI